MTLFGSVLGYDPVARVAYVDLPGRGRVEAFNYLPKGRTPTTSLVNSMLSPEEANTIMPAETFGAGVPVAVYWDQTQYFVLGIKIADAAASVITPVLGRPGPGMISVTKTLTTDGAGSVMIPEVGERAHIRYVRITKQGGGTFTAKIYNGENRLQASWGDGDIPAVDAIEDAAGFPFWSADRAAHFELLPVGTYTVDLSGERFA